MPRPVITPSKRGAKAEIGSLRAEAGGTLAAGAKRDSNDADVSAATGGDGCDATA
jgi:hypothetical protein